MKEYLRKSLKRQGYEAPKAEVMAIELQGILCTSDGGGTRVTGDGFQFGTSDGQW